MPSCAASVHSVASCSPTNLKQLETNLKQFFQPKPLPTIVFGTSASPNLKRSRNSRGRCCTRTGPKKSINMQLSLNIHPRGSMIHALPRHQPARQTPCPTQIRPTDLQLLAATGGYWREKFSEPTAVS